MLGRGRRRVAQALGVTFVLAPGLVHADVAPGPVEGNLWLIISLAFTWGGIALYQWMVKRGRNKAMAAAIVLAVIAAGDVAAYYIYQSTHARPHRYRGELGR